MSRRVDDPETEVQFDQRMLEMSLGILKPQSPEQRLREQAEIERTMHFVAAYHAEVMPEYDELFV